MIKSARTLILGAMMLMTAGFGFAAPAEANILRTVQDVGVAAGVIPRGCMSGNVIYSARCHASNAEYKIRNRRMRAERETQRRGEVARTQTVRQAHVDPRIIAMVRDLETACRGGNQSACRQLGAR